MSASESGAVESSRKVDFDSQEQAEIRELKTRDREVRAHEAAHMAAGGGATGGAQYTYQRGPDGVMYAVAGEVSISASSASNSPQAALQRAETIRRAALAPANPSSQDRQVAANASAMAAQARSDIAQERRDDQERRVTDNPEIELNRKTEAYLTSAFDHPAKSDLDVFA